MSRAEFFGSVDKRKISAMDVMVFLGAQRSSIIIPFSQALSHGRAKKAKQRLVERGSKSARIGRGWVKIGAMFRNRDRAPWLGAFNVFSVFFVFFGFFFLVPGRQSSQKIIGEGQSSGRWPGCPSPRGVSAWKRLRAGTPAVCVNNGS